MPAITVDLPNALGPSGDGSPHTVSPDLCDDSHSWVGSAYWSVGQIVTFAGTDDTVSASSVMRVSDIRDPGDLLCGLWGYTLA